MCTYTQPYLILKLLRIHDLDRGGSGEKIVGERSLYSVRMRGSSVCESGAGEEKCGNS